jgi:intracellular septation protein
MKRLFDLLPIVVFFIAFRYAHEHKESAAAFASTLLGLWVAGISIGANEAPVLLAIAASGMLALTQAAWLRWRGQHIDITLWLALALVVVVSGFSLYFHGQSFNKWKPSALFWAMGLTFWLSQLLFGRNLTRLLLGEQMQVPARVWHRLNFAWIAFFALMGLLNLWVAHSFPTDAWVDFSLFGGIALVLGFIVAQGLFLGRYLMDDAGRGGASADST